MYYQHYASAVMVTVPPYASDASVWVGHNLDPEKFVVARPAGFQQFIGR